MIPCYDIIAMLCDAVLERMPLLQKMGKEIPPDMYVTLHTLIYAAPRAGIEELVTVGRQLGFLCGPEFVKQSQTDEKCVNETIRENINLILPEEGWRIEKLIQIAKEEGIQYTPTEKSNQAYLTYTSSKAGIANLNGFPSGSGVMPYVPLQLNVPISAPPPILLSGPYNIAPTSAPVAPFASPMPPAPQPGSNLPPAPQNYPPLSQGPPSGLPTAPGLGNMGMNMPPAPPSDPLMPGEVSTLDDFEARLANLKKM
eukprot:TRINITY_DN862_c0_g1_i1.p1 TRINITY_DN862_c0_g1~~TRINITY_DN862_c0_g1_i1.p1  ORF type:complete len:255 (+),score=53.84 TRINITY_DN862_c0_g1_i1:371-1135(+)